MRRLLPVPLPEDCPNLPGPGQPTRWWQSEPARRSRSRADQQEGPYLEPTLTTSRRRPFWRRRFRVFRPPLVCMRARNPCLFFRFRFRGLYVGIMISHPLATWLHFKISFQRYQSCPARVNPGSPFGLWVSPSVGAVRLTFPHSRNSLPALISGPCLLGSGAAVAPDGFRRPRRFVSSKFTIPPILQGDCPVKWGAIAHGPSQRDLLRRPWS